MPAVTNDQPEYRPPPAAAAVATARTSGDGASTATRPATTIVSAAVTSARRAQTDAAKASSHPNAPTAASRAARAAAASAAGARAGTETVLGATTPQPPHPGARQHHAAERHGEPQHPDHTARSCQRNDEVLSRAAASWGSHPARSGSLAAVRTGTTAASAAAASPPPLLPPPSPLLMPCRPSTYSTSLVSPHAAASCRPRTRGHTTATVAWSVSWTVVRRARYTKGGALRPCGQPPWQRPSQRRCPHPCRQPAIQRRPRLAVDGVPVQCHPASETRVHLSSALLPRRVCERAGARPRGRLDARCGGQMS